MREPHWTAEAQPLLCVYAYILKIHTFALRKRRGNKVKGQRTNRSRGKPKREFPRPWPVFPPLSPPTSSLPPTHPPPGSSLPQLLQHASLHPVFFFVFFSQLPFFVFFCFLVRIMYLCDHLNYWHFGTYPTYKKKKQINEWKTVSVTGAHLHVVVVDVVVVGWFVVIIIVVLVVVMLLSLSSGVVVIIIYYFCFQNFVFYFYAYIFFFLFLFLGCFKLPVEL